MFRSAMTCWLVAALATAVAAADQRSAKPGGEAPAKPDCTVSDARSSAMPPEASRLPVDARRAIFVELQDVVARAQRDAARAYPAAESGAMMAPTNVQKDSKLTRKRDIAALANERVYLANVLKQRSLTCAAARDIMREGKAAGWPVQK